VFNELYPKVATEPDVQELYGSIRDYLERLDADNVNDKVVARGLGLFQVSLRVLAHLSLLFLSLPLFVVGAPVFLPISLLLKLLGGAISPRSDTVATTKFMLGFATMMALYIGLVTWSFFHYGLWHGLGTMALVPAAGAATIHVISRVNALKHLMLTTIRVFTLRRELHALRQERDRLVLRVQELVDKYRDSLEAPASEAHQPTI